MNQKMIARVILLLSLISVRCLASTDSLAKNFPIRIYDPRVTHPLLSTQLTVSAGTARVARSDRPLFSTALECKGIYNLTGALYISGGGGFSLMRSEARPAGGDRYDRQVFLAYAPAGIGFVIGDDRAKIITGIDVLPGIYFHDGNLPEQSRRFAYGLGPEFGFLFHTGHRGARGMEIGMTGKIRFMQSPDEADGGSIRYGYGGMGLMLRF